MNEYNAILSIVVFKFEEEGCTEAEGLKNSGTL
jgi:hypothetical protein